MRYLEAIIYNRCIRDALLLSLGHGQLLLIYVRSVVDDEMVGRIFVSTKPLFFV